MRRSLIFAVLWLMAFGWAAAQTPVPADAPYKNPKLGSISAWPTYWAA